MKGTRRNTLKPRRWQGTAQPGDSNDRPSVHLGRCSGTEYVEVANHLKALQTARRFGRTPPGATLAWLASVDDRLHQRIVRAGLCEARAGARPPEVTLAQYVSDYIDRRKDIGECARLNLRQTEKQLTEFFGADRSMASITVGDAKDFRRGLVTDAYSLATIAMHVKKARQFFADAVDREILKSNPFRKVEAGSQVNPANMQYVDLPSVEKVIAVAPDARWRLIIGLARYAGLRCPSEVRALRWGDVLSDPDRIRVESGKTRKQGKAVRITPVCTRLRELLLAAKPSGDVDAEAAVIPDLDGSDNLRTQLGRLCKRAGVNPWPKMLQNLRLSCETDWMDSASLALACKWSGNTPDVALKHYHLVREVDYFRASGRGAESGAEQCKTGGSGTEGAKSTTAASVASSSTYLSVPLGSLAAVAFGIPPRGVEQGAKTSGKPPKDGKGGAKSGAPGAPTLNAAERAKQKRGSKPKNLPPEIRKLIATLLRPYR